MDVVGMALLVFLGLMALVMVALAVIILAAPDPGENE